MFINCLVSDNSKVFVCYGVDNNFLTTQFLIKIFIILILYRSRSQRLHQRRHYNHRAAFWLTITPIRIHSEWWEFPSLLWFYFYLLTTQFYLIDKFSFDVWPFFFLPFFPLNRNFYRRLWYCELLLLNSRIILWRPCRCFEAKVGRMGHRHHGLGLPDILTATLPGRSLSSWESWK